MKNLKALSSNINPGVGRESIHRKYQYCFVRDRKMLL